MLRDGLFLKVILAGLVPLLGASALVLWQSSRNVARQDRERAGETAQRLASTVDGLFAQWRTEILIAANNEALQRWYRFPAERDALRPAIDRLQVQLNSLYPDLIDEGCVIDAGGAEQARQVHGTPAAIADLSPDESHSPFFAATMALAPGRVLQATPYVSADSERWVVSNSTPIVVDGKTVAFLHFEASLEGTRQRLAAAVPAGTVARIVDAAHGTVLLSTDGAAVAAGEFAVADRMRGVVGTAPVPRGADNQNDWRLEVSTPSSAAVRGTDVVELLAFVLVAVAGLILVALQFRARLVQPIEEVLVVADRMADGDLTQRIELAAHDDVIGRMSGAVNRAVERLDGAIEQIDREADALQQASGELTGIADGMADRAASTDRLVGSLSTALEGVNTSVSVVADSSEGLNTAIHEIAQRSAAITSTARDASSMARNTSEAVERLAAASNEIGEVLTSIRVIAHTTNQLALNATIEAARAGESGRGFAVVAKEVKSLSQETATATAEIEQRIQAVQMETALVDEAIRSIAAVVSNIEGEQTSIAAAVEEQLASAAEIAKAAEAAASETGRISGVVEAVESSTRESSTGADRNRTLALDVAERSRTLADLAASFRHR